MDGQHSLRQAENSMFRHAHADARWAADTTATADEKNLNRYSRGDVADETTRCLAAATQVDLGYARAVRFRVIGEPFHALAPAYGAEPAVIARWALSALRRRFRRDVVLTTVFIASAVLFAVLWAERPWHAWIPFFVIMVLAAVIGVVTTEKFQIQRTLVTRMRRAVFNPADAPEPGSEKIRQRLAAVADRRDGNLVIFQGSSPFVGSGREIHRWHLTLDVSRGRKLSSGTRRKPTGFTSAELHAEIVDAFNRMGLPYAHAEERLFVSGRYIQDNPNLLPGWNPPAAPPAYVDDSVLNQAALDPTPDARVYVCAEIPGWRGQLVTTVFARAVHAGDSLYVECSFHVLPPLSKLFPDIDSLYDEPAAQQLGKALGWGLLYAVPAFLRAPLALAEHGWHRVRLNVRRGVQSWKISRGQVFNYGATRSIREDASGFSDQNYFIRHDRDMTILLAQETLLHTIGNFLEQHDVDLGEFDGRVQFIMNSTQKNYNVGNVSGTGIVIGDKSAVTNAGNVRVPPESAPGAKE